VLLSADALTVTTTGSITVTVLQAQLKSCYWWLTLLLLLLLLLLAALTSGGKISAMTPAPVVMNAATAGQHRRATSCTLCVGIDTF
jgi:hypothetical protein